jgi:hypothetical protein
MGEAEHMPSGELSSVGEGSDGCTQGSDTQGSDTFGAGGSTEAAGGGAGTVARSSATLRLSSVSVGRGSGSPGWGQRRLDVNLTTKRLSGAIIHASGDGRMGRRARKTAAATLTKTRGGVLKMSLIPVM